jgi:signal transduction histidine kinase
MTRYEEKSKRDRFRNNKRSEEARMDKTKILIVEDSITQAMQLQNILEVNGYDAAIAANGREALQLIGESKPALVISDIIMPEIDGFELCRNIKADEGLRCIPVILLTSLSDPQDVIRAVQSGADQFVIKPYDGKHLSLTIKHLLHDEHLRNREDNQREIDIFYRDEKYSITSSRRQILNLLLSTYETAMVKNRDLIRTQDELRNLNEDLEEMVSKRTAALHGEIAERKSAETALRVKNEELNAVTQQLWQAAKLATMGELASSIAHELNNPLAIVSLRIESLTAKAAQKDPCRRELEIIGHEVERMGNLVTRLLQFSRRSQKQLSTVYICEDIQNTIELVHYHLSKNNIKVIREFAPKVPRIIADHQQLRQLFLNLFTNATDAMPEGGTFTIRVAPLPEENKVCIEVADTGTGISPEILSRVIEPFYTTKPEGKGTGLGLAICRRIAQEHGGALSITSEGIPGKGSIVRITLSSMDPGNSIGLMGR